MAYDDGAAGLQRHEGTIKSFNPEKGWGHIECPETFEQYGKDVFLLKSQLQGDVSVVAKGQIVSFCLTDNGRGPEATEIQVLGDGPAATSFIPGFSTVMPSSAAVVSSGNFVGVIKSFNPTSGWGHITCEQTEQIYGKDMFYMKSQLPGGFIERGVQVQFSVTQGTKGPEAAAIRPLGGGGGVGGPVVGGPVVGGSMVGGPQWQSMHSPAPQWQVMPSPAPQWQSPPQPRSVQPPPHMRNNVSVVGALPGLGGSVYYGTIKSFNEEKGWGHITCPQTQAMYGKDMFLLRSALNGAVVAPGDAVQFAVAMGQKGPEAASVRVIGATNQQEMFTGAIKLWNEEKKWGFIECLETHQLYGKDIFFHKKDLGENVPSPGEVVQFSVQISPEGRPEATGIAFLSNANAVGGDLGGCGYGAWKGGAGGPRPGPW
mmetsp:Transcript_24647/g.70127  ORF Transcript_24647/g.70127 Transcript_24647/m.70127 type:complete len:428 (-) Transcript_24647:56-1339(-)